MDIVEISKMKFNYLILFLFITFTFSACKYEKGPIISFKDRDLRIDGNWKITKVLVDGEDKFSDIDSLDIDYLDLVTESGTMDAEANYRGESNKIYSPSDSCGGMSNWGFTEENKPTSISFTDRTVCGSIYDSLAIPLMIGLPEEWEVIKLTNKKLWLKMERDSKVYETHFTKI